MYTTTLILIRDSNLQDGGTTDSTWVKGGLERPSQSKTINHGAYHEILLNEALFTENKRK